MRALFGRSRVENDVRGQLMGSTGKSTEQGRSAHFDFGTVCVKGNTILRHPS